MKFSFNILQDHVKAFSVAYQAYSLRSSIKVHQSSRLPSVGLDDQRKFNIWEVQGFHLFSPIASFFGYNMAKNPLFRL